MWRQDQEEGYVLLVYCMAGLTSSRKRNINGLTFLLISYYGTLLKVLSKCLKSKNTFSCLFSDRHSEYKGVKITKIRSKFDRQFDCYQAVQWSVITQYHAHSDGLVLHLLLSSRPGGLLSATCVVSWRHIVAIVNRTEANVTVANVILKQQSLPKEGVNDGTFKQ